MDSGTCSVMIIVLKDPAIVLKAVLQDPVLQDPEAMSAVLLQPTVLILLCCRARTYLY